MKWSGWERLGAATGRDPSGGIIEILNQDAVCCLRHLRQIIWRNY